MNKQLTNLMEKDKQIQNHYAKQMLSGQVQPEDYIAKTERLSNAYKKRLLEIMRSYENMIQL